MLSADPIIIRFGLPEAMIFPLNTCHLYPMPLFVGGGPPSQSGTRARAVHNPCRQGHYLKIRRCHQTWVFILSPLVMLQIRQFKQDTWLTNFMLFLSEGHTWFVTCWTSRVSTKYVTLLVLVRAEVNDFSLLTVTIFWSICDFLWADAFVICLVDC